MTSAVNHNCLFLFHTPLGVIQLKKKLTRYAMPFTVIDAPRKLSAECGMGVQFFLPDEKRYFLFINDQVKAVYLIEDDRYISIWQDES